MASIVTPKRLCLRIIPFLSPSRRGELSGLELRRNQSSYRRTKQRLRVKPDASFGHSPNKLHDHIIHNPPSSAPSVYETPTKFLPADDIRRTLRPGNNQVKTDGNSLPPVFKETPDKKYHLKPSDIEEIRRLRMSDPMVWSRWKLAKKFECSPLFIMMVCEASPQKKQIQRQVLEAVQTRWGLKRKLAREDRQLRKESWGRDE